VYKKEIYDAEHFKIKDNKEKLDFVCCGKIKGKTYWQNC